MCLQSILRYFFLFLFFLFLYTFRWHGWCGKRRWFVTMSWVLFPTRFWPVNLMRETNIEENCGSSKLWKRRKKTGILVKLKSSWKPIYLSYRLIHKFHKSTQSHFSPLRNLSWNLKRFSLAEIHHHLFKYHSSSDSFTS